MPPKHAVAPTGECPYCKGKKPLPEVSKIDKNKRFCTEFCMILGDRPWKNTPDHQYCEFCRAYVWTGGTMERDEDGNVTAMYCSTSCKSGVPHHKLSKQHRKRLEDSAPLGGIPYQATDNSGQKKKPSFEWYSQSSPVSRVPVPVPQHASQTESDDSNMPDLVEKEDERNESSEEEKPKKKQKKKKHPSPPPRRKKIKASDIVISSHHDVSVF